MEKKILMIILTAVVLGTVGVLVWGFGGSIPELTGPGSALEGTLDGATPGEEIVVEGEEPADTEKTPIETAFEKAKNVEISGAKAKAVDADLRPVLKSVFDVVVDEQIVNGVKMREEFGPMLTYAVNRKMTEIERDAIISGLETAGVTSVDSTEKVVTVKKGNAMWVISFYLNNEQKSGLEITF